MQPWEFAIVQSESTKSDPGSLKNLFLLSFHDRDPLAAEISGFGWRVSSARRTENLRERFLSSTALIAVVDVRRSENTALAAIAKLAAMAENGGFAVVALADPAAQVDIAEKCHAAGATHFFDMAGANADLQQALNFAYRYVEHVRGGAEGVERFSALLAQSDQQWSFARSHISGGWISENLRNQLPAVNFDAYPATGIYRLLSDAERARVRGAMGRLKEGSAQAAVPHELNGERVIHHLHLSSENLFGRIEPLTFGESVDDWTKRDLLSGLRNASAARGWMRARLAEQQKLGVLTLGLKNFRTINAAFGRPVGDQILRIIGQRLLAATTELAADQCLVARIDGQNFLISSVLNQSPEIFVEFSEHLLASIFHPAVVEGRSVQLIARAGVAIDSHPSDETVLIRHASLALAEAMASDAILLKRSNASGDDALLEQELEAQLEQAINRGQITIALQPQMRVDTGQLIGAEALARWDHPEFGLLGAATLFAVAERAGLMEMLSAHIHERALSVGASWPDSLSFLRLSINVTAGDLAHRAFSRNLIKKIRKSGFPADHLTLEITESELINDMAGSVGRLQELREQGIRIAIDDFGTGYSSLAYLKDLPLDYLKIDSGLTSDIGGSRKDQVVVRSIIDMAQSLYLEVIAEGVETEAQLETLTLQGCEFFQGFLRSGPLSAEEFELFALRSN